MCHKLSQLCCQVSCSCSMEKQSQIESYTYVNVIQEYEMVAEEGTRAEQLAKQQNTLKQR